jgi:hypothetical protein
VTDKGTRAALPKPHSVWAFVILALYLAFLAFLLLYPILVPWSPPKESPPIIEKPQWRIAIVTEDPVFAELINSTIKAKELAVIPPARAEESASFDLAIIGWDVLPVISANPELVTKLLNSTRLIAVAEPGQDALTLLFSGLVEPVKIGEKKPTKDPIAFLPLVEKDGYLVPGCECSVILLEARQAPGGKLILGYREATLTRKNRLPWAIAAVLGTP